MANNIFDDISMEELNEMLNNLPNDFDSEKKIEKRIQKKTMHRINVSETSSKRNEALRAITTIAAVCVMVIAVMWAVGFDNVSAYVKKTFFVPGMSSAVSDDGNDIWVETTPSEVIVHKKEEYVPLVLKEPVTVSNGNGSLTLVSVVSSEKVQINKSPEEYEDISQYYIDQGGKYYSGININLQIELNNKTLTKIKEAYPDLYNEDGSINVNSKAFDDFGNFGNYNFSVSANGNKYTDIGRDANYLDAYGHFLNFSKTDDWNIGFDGWTFVIDAADIKAGQTYTLTVDHEFAGKLSLDFVLEAADELGSSDSHETVSVTHNGMTVTAIKYDTEISGKKYVAVATDVDISALNSAAHDAVVTSYTDNNGIYHPVVFKKADGTRIAPEKVEDEIYFFDAAKVDDGDDFIVPAVWVFSSDNSQTGFEIPIPSNVGKTEKTDVVINDWFGKINIDKVELVEDYSYGDTVTKGKGLLIHIDWEDIDQRSQLNYFYAIRENTTHTGGDVINDSTNYIEMTDTALADAPYFILLQDTDSDSIKFTNWTYHIYATTEYKFNF